MSNQQNINFVKKDKTVLKLQVRRMYIIQTASMFILGAYILALFLVFSYSTFLSYQNKTTEKNIKKENTEIEKLSAIEAKYIILKQKVEAGVNTTKSMYRYQDLMQALFQLIPSDLLVDGFMMDKDNNVKFSAKTKNPYTIEDFIAKVMQYNSNQTGNKLTKATINSTSVDRDGIYTMNVTLYVNFMQES